MQTEEIRILGRDELISAVIAKHERMIADYSSEYDTLKNTFTELDTEINDLKKSIEELEGKNDESGEKISGKISVYEEKKNLFGNDAMDELEKLKLETMDDDKIKSGLQSLISSKSDTVQERQISYDALLSNIGNVSEKDTGLLLSKIDATFNAYKDENAAKEAAVSKKALLKEKEGKVSENKRVGWLEKRIASHNESLEYWKGIQLK